MFTDTLLLEKAGRSVRADRSAMLRLGVERTLAETLLIKGNMDDNPLTRGGEVLTAFKDEKELKRLLQNKN